MPLIQVTMVQGRTTEQKHALMSLFRWRIGPLPTKRGMAFSRPGPTSKKRQLQ